MSEIDGFVVAVFFVYVCAVWAFAAGARHRLLCCILLLTGASVAGIAGAWAVFTADRYPHAGNGPMIYGAAMLAAEFIFLWIELRVRRLIRGNNRRGNGGTSGDPRGNVTDLRDRKHLARIGTQKPSGNRRVLPRE